MISSNEFARFPGRELDEYSSPQFVGCCNMSPDEYDELIADPVKFNFEKILPRIAGNLKDPSLRRPWQLWLV